MFSSSPTPPPNRLVSGINPKQAGSALKGICNCFPIWPGRTPTLIVLLFLHMSFLAGPVCLSVHHFAVPVKLSLLGLLCNWESSQFLSRPFSYLGITCSLINSNQFSVPASWPRVECGRCLKGLEEAALDAASRRLWLLFTVLSLESQVPLIQMEISPDVLIFPGRKAGIMVELWIASDIPK